MGHVRTSKVQCAIISELFMPEGDMLPCSSVYLVVYYQLPNVNSTKKNVYVINMTHYIDHWCADMPQCTGA